MREIKEIIIHCSDSTFGSAAAINEWHKGYGWKAIGYHFVILNGMRAPGGEYSLRYDGAVERGRPVEEIGAHTQGHNRYSVGVCLVGRKLFTPIQLLETLPDLLDTLMTKYGLALRDVLAHRDFNRQKICPGFDLPRYLRILRKLGRF